MNTVDRLESNSAVKIVVREKPFATENNIDRIVNYEAKSDQIIIVDDRAYCFDRVFDPNVTQQQLFDDVIKPMVDKVKQGFNCTALAYGQTGTGKSYTMGLSAEINNEEEAGVVRRCIWELFTDIENYDLSISFIEIYNEKVFDLLSTNPQEPIMSKGLKFVGGTRKKVITIEECNDIIKHGISKRRIRPTVMNNQSSRSHVIFSIAVVSTNVAKPTFANLNLVDLGGSEGVRRTGHMGAAMSEGVHINQGLLCIGKILQAMSEGQKVIPYRDSVLGAVLHESLSTNSYLTLLACISAQRIDLSETLSTIRFAQRAKQLKCTPQINSLLTELNKNKTKTPYNARTVTLTKQPTRPTSFKNSIQHSNTFCTPVNGQKKRIEPQFNHTEIGLTPKEKNKAQSLVQAVPPLRQYSSITQRESLFEPTMESWNLNVSSSTTMDAPSSMNKPLSYSPIVQKCMEKFETALENKMLKFMETFTKANSMFVNSMMSTPIPNRTCVPFPPQVTQEQQDTTMGLVNPKNTNCQLFVTSSPVFKMPVAPSQRKTPTSSVALSNGLITDNSLTQAEFGSFDGTIIQQTVRNVRRSMRISERNNNSILNDSQNVSINQSLRRSTRKRTMLHTLPEQLEHATEQKPKLQKLQTAKVLDNTVIAGYLSGNVSSSVHPKKVGIAKHRSAILELLNKGSIKELQILPQIGQKTAFKLVTHRTMHGKFKTLKQVEKLPIWNGTAWERFAKVNMLV